MMIMINYRTFFQSLLPTLVMFPTLSDSLFITSDMLSLCLLGGRFETCSPVSSLGCLAIKPCFAAELSVSTFWFAVQNKPGLVIGLVRASPGGEFTGTFLPWLLAGTESLWMSWRSCLIHAFWNHPWLSLVTCCGPSGKWFLGSHLEASFVWVTSLKSRTCF